jgi:outer membrane immunogenic protein
MIQRFVVSALSFAALVSTAYADEFSTVTSWGGFYAGGNIGYGWSRDDSEKTTGNDFATQINVALGTIPSSRKLDRDGVTAGGQLGYNWVFPTLGGVTLVTGVEADIAYLDSSASSQGTFAFGVQGQYKQSLDYLGTVRGRLGFASDNILVYATGGLAYGETSYSHNVLSNQTPPKTIWGGSQSGMQAGWAAGAGVEYALSANWSLKAEWLHYDLGSQSVKLQGGLGAPHTLTDKVSTEGDLVRTGLNYHF